MKFKFTYLSPLESDILKILWRKKKSKVRDVYKKLVHQKKVALTSVAVLLDRLHKKGFVKREISHGKGGFHYIYFPTYPTEQNFHRHIIEKSIDQLMKSFGSTAITYFNEKFSKKRGKK